MSEESSSVREEGSAVQCQRVISPWVGPDWRHLLITDVDNTLFDFGLYAEAGLTALVPAASQLLGMSPLDVAEELKAAYRIYNSVETPWAFEHMASIRHQPESEQRRIARVLAGAYWAGASRDMRPYEGVVETMSALWRSGTAIVAVSDAPIWEAWRKLRQLGLFQYFAGIVAVGSLKRRPSPAALKVEDVPEYRAPSRSPLRFYRLLGDEDRKPSPEAYRRVLEEIPLPLSDVVVVGDSPLKDLVPARELGISAYWAEYGERNRHLEYLLPRITPFEPPEAIESQAEAARPFPTLKKFDDLELIFDLPQQRLRF
jgi:FMN phosphatase YigB (HAD superfamily)